MVYKNDQVSFVTSRQISNAARRLLNIRYYCTSCAVVSFDTLKLLTNLNGHVFIIGEAIDMRQGFMKVLQSL